MTASLLALAIVVGALAVALLPLLRVEDAAVAPAGDALRRSLEAERDELVDALREARLDLDMGKITAEDHAELQRSLEDRAVAVMARIDTLPRTSEDAGR